MPFSISAVAIRLGVLPLAAGAFVATAYAAEPIHVRGTVASVDGPNVTLKTNDDKTIRLTLGPNWKIAGIIPAAIGDIKPGTFIGTANVEAPDGNTALEVVVFPEAMRGTGEGNYGWDLKPNSSMTNATVNNAVEGVNGRTVTLSYKGGERKVTIPPTAPIVTVGPGSDADVVPGAKVFAAGAPTDDGTMLTKGFIAVGKNGIAPPM